MAKIVSEDRQVRSRPIGKTRLKILKDKSRNGYTFPSYKGETKERERSKRVGERVALRRDASSALEEAFEAMTAHLVRGQKSEVRAVHFRMVTETTTVIEYA